ncbi:MAG TPA: hypothetical protein VMB85_24175 [Bryobacteraceae bacterium]|nr:hypothetical protein [Bryobacteraceae bacterium]
MLDELQSLKGRFGRDAARRTAELLERARFTRFRVPDDLTHLHETVLFLRAYPQSPRVRQLADEILFSFADRLRGLDREPFEDPEVSGIAGTGLSTNFSYDVAKSLAARYLIQIDWENYEHADRLGPVLAKLIPLAGEDAAVEPHVDWRRWFESAHGSAKWLIDRVDREVYDLLEIPLRWELGDSPASRSRTRLPRREMFYHDGPLIRRSEVSLEAVFKEPPIAVQRIARPKKILELILDTSAVRYRELYGFSHPDAAHVYHADFGRGVDFFFCGVPPEWRLPLRAYHAGMFFKNGVPAGYFEGLSLFERMECGFNLYYTFREGETAWLYARILKLFREQLGVTCYSIDRYQIGDENEEAIESGAFWFYRKLGFRSTSKEIARLIGREEQRMARHPEHRTTPAMLRKLARAPLIYGGGQEWDGFELRNLRKMPKLSRDLQRAKRAPEETGYLRLLQRDRALRAKILSPPSGRSSKYDRAR